MHIVVVGCGRVGSELAIQLCADGHDVVVIDRNRDSFRRLGNFTGRTIVGSGFDEDVLKEARVAHADGLAAVTSGDNSNILCARIARDHYNVKNVVARIYDPNRAFIYQKLGIPTVATSGWTTTQVRRWLLPTDSTTEWQSNTGNMTLVERVLPDALAGRELGHFHGATFRLAGVVRGGVGRVDFDTLFAQEDDLLQFMVANNGSADLDAFLAGGAQ